MNPIKVCDVHQLPQELIHTVFDPIFPKHWLINKPFEEIKALALKEAEEVSPRYVRGKQVKRKEYSNYRFLAGFSIIIKGRRVEYKLKWISVKLPVMYNEKRRVKTTVEKKLLREEEVVLRKLLTFYSVLGGKLNAKLWNPELEIQGDFQYVIVDGKWVKLKGGEGVLLVAMGVTSEGKRAVLDFLLANEEDARSYWKLLTRVWRKFSFTFVVADMIKSVDRALELSGIKAKRQLCLNHVKKHLNHSERKEVDLLISGVLTEFSDRVKELVERGLLSFLSLPQEIQRLLSTNNLVESFNSLVERRRFGKYHTPHRLLQIVWAIVQNYNIFSNFSHRWNSIHIFIIISTIESVLVN